MPIHHTYISPRMGSTNRDTYGASVRRNTGSAYHDHAVNGLKYWYEDTKPMPRKLEGKREREKTGWCMVGWRVSKIEQI